MYNSTISLTPKFILFRTFQKEFNNCLKRYLSCCYGFKSKFISNTVHFILFFTALNCYKILLCFWFHCKNNGDLKLISCFRKWFNLLFSKQRQQLRKMFSTMLITSIPNGILNEPFSRFTWFLVWSWDPISGISFSEISCDGM